MTAGVLQGIKIIEFGLFQLIPAATCILADLGAEVIKIEDPNGGDPVRHPVPIEDLLPPTPPASLWFEHYNRNKKSLAVDVNLERGREVLYKLVETADVFATNFDPRFIDRVRADYDTLRRMNPRLVYCQCTGYGIQGPDKHKPGFDYTAWWARSGMMDRLAEPGGVPRSQGPGMRDNLSAPAVAGGIVTGLFARERTGIGQKVEFSLYHFGVWGLTIDIVPALNAGKQIRRTDELSLMQS